MSDTATAGSDKNVLRNGFGQIIPHPANPATASSAAPQPEPAKPADTPVVDAAPAAQPGADAAPKPEPATPVVDFSSMSDEDFNKILAARTKGKITSLSDLEPKPNKTKEELEAEEKKMELEATTWALSNGKVKKEDYDQAMSDKDKPAREIALKLFTASLREEDKDITDEEAEELFKDTYHEDKEPTTKLYKLGQKEIEKLASSYRKEKYSAVDSIKSDYQNHQTMVGQYKAYAAQVKEAVSAVPDDIDVSVPYTAADGKETTLSYKVKVDDKLKAKLIKDFSDMFLSFSGDKGVNPKALAAEIQYHVKARSFDKVLAESLAQHGKNVEELLMVHLGNKRNPGTNLNPGVQNLNPTTQKLNDYPNLNKQIKK